MLEELGQPYQLVVLPLLPQALQSSCFEINPLGTVPLMVDGPVRMTDSAAICQYLCARRAPTSRQIEPPEEGFGDYLNFGHFGEATLTFPQALVLRYLRFELPARPQPSVGEDYAKRMRITVEAPRSSVRYGRQSARSCLACGP